MARVGLLHQRKKVLLLYGPNPFFPKMYRTTILPVVLYGDEMLSVTLREEYGLSMLENRVLRRIFGPKREEVTGEWRRLHNEELYDVYSSPNINMVMK